MLSTTYSEGVHGSDKVKRARLWDRESPWFGVESPGTGPFVSKGNETVVCVVESGCVTVQSLVLSISIMCKDLWKLLHDINTSVLNEWNHERISYKL
jgi:hypothetical protein